MSIKVYRVKIEGYRGLGAAEVRALVRALARVRANLYAAAGKTDDPAQS